MGFLILIVICAIIGFVLVYMDWNDFGDALLGGICGLLIGFMLSLALSIVLDCTLEKEYYLYDKNQVYALQDGNSMNGNFFLGSGYIDGKMKYTYLVKEDRGMEIKTISTEGNYIKESNSKSPNIKTYSSRHKNKTMEHLFPMAFLSDKYSIITVPKHSIRYDYNVDLKD